MSIKTTILDTLGRDEQKGIFGEFIDTELPDGGLSVASERMKK